MRIQPITWRSAGALLLALAACGDKGDTVTDADGDGFSAAVDCDDDDAAVFPGAPEVCDGIDSDCDGAVDDDPADGTVYAIDFDGDGYGSAALSVRACAPPDAGYVADTTDCNDLSAAAYPGGEEVCDEVDNDCNGEVDDNAVDVRLFYFDADGDGYGSPAMSSQRCFATGGYVDNGKDCDDTDASINPETRWFPDLDGDGFGSDYFSVVGCEAPPQHALEAADCNDEDDQIYPGAAERCNAQDDDCDGVLPAGDADDDGDGVPVCGGDCDTADATVYPGAEEVCGDGLDNDCDGYTDNRCPTDADSADVLISGESTSDNFGYSVAVGDVDGDGVDDILAGATGDDNNGASSGSAYLMRGPISAGAYKAGTDTAARFLGEVANDYLGTLIAVGDYDDDGYDDVAISAYGQDTGGSIAGAVYLFFGPIADGDHEAEDADVRIDGYSSSQYLGYYVLVSGDVDGSGGDDLMIGAYFASSYAGYISLFTDFSEDMAADEGAALISGTSSSSYVGYGGTLPGDLSGDGVPDVVYGEPGRNAVHVLYGPASGDLGASDADLTYDNSSDSGDYPGAKVGSGDLNGDGYLDLLLSSKYDDTSADSSGLVGVFYGPITATGSRTFHTWDAAVVGASASDYVGQNQDGLTTGDQDGDGLDDLFLGVSSLDQGGSAAGAALLYYGPLSGTLTTAQYDRGFFGTVANDYVGRQSVVLGDVDGDGALDPVFGAYGAGTAGEAYVFLGSGL